MGLDTFEHLISRMAALGAQTLLIKPLAENDNSKNQVYLGTGYEALREIPSGELQASEGTSAKKRGTKILLKARLEFFWVDAESCCLAPGAQLILYPQYPEVRMSGFLRGCSNAPSGLMGKSPGLPGRILFLGIADGRLLAHVTGMDSPLGQEVHNWLERENDGEVAGVFRKIVLQGAVNNQAGERKEFLRKLAEIWGMGWIPSCRLQADGSLVPYTARNGAGYTLEAACGILPNGRPLPDYLGWEIKAVATNATHWPRLNPAARITLMTPEPTLGVYAENIDLFRERYAKPRKGDPDCMYFTGVRSAGRSAEAAELIMRLEGVRDGKIMDATARIILLDRQRDDIAAGWALADILEHWRRKHSRAAYVSYEKRGVPPEYRYSNIVRLGEGYDFSLIIKAFSEGIIVHDPGVKFTRMTGGWKSHRRNQFRVAAKELAHLYRSCADIDVETTGRG